MEKIGFFGGSFNPPTIAHLKIVEKALEEFGLEKVVIVPMGDKYEKSELISFNLRFYMLEETFKDLGDKVEISKMQENQLTRSYAIDNFKEINNIYKNSENFFIMGEDNFSKLEQWKGANELIENYKYIVLKRNNLKLQTEIKNCCFMNFSYDISSTEVRQKIKDNKSLENYLNNNVINFINKNNLYNN